MKLRPLITPVLFSMLFCFCGCKKSVDAQSREGADSARAGKADSLTADIPANLEKPKDFITFKYLFRKGDVFGYSIATTERVNIKRDTITEDSKQRTVYRYKFEVLDANPGGGGRLRATCLRVEFDGEYKDVKGSRNMQFDSDKKNERDKEKVFAQWNAPVNTPFELTVDAEGKIASVSNLDGVIRKYMGDDYNSTKTEQRKMVERDYGDNALKNVIQLAFQKFENKQMAVDSAWIIKWTGNIGFLKVDNTAIYTLKGFQNVASGKLAHIAVKMTSNYIGAKKLDTGQGLATMDAFDIGGGGVSVFNVDKMRASGRKLSQRIYTKFFVEIPEELKKMAPEMRDFWMIQDASVDNLIEEIKF